MESALAAEGEPSADGTASAAGAAVAVDAEGDEQRSVTDASASGPADGSVSLLQQRPARTGGARRRGGSSAGSRATRRPPRTSGGAEGGGADESNASAPAGGSDAALDASSTASALMTDAPGSDGGQALDSSELMSAPHEVASDTSPARPGGGGGAAAAAAASASAGAQRASEQHGAAGAASRPGGAATATTIGDTQPEQPTGCLASLCSCFRSPSDTVRSVLHARGALFRALTTRPCVCALARGRATSSARGAAGSKPLHQSAADSTCRRGHPERYWCVCTSPRHVHGS